MTDARGEAVASQDVTAQVASSHAPAELAGLRAQMDAINADMLALFERRMDVAAQIADAKRTTGRPVADFTRERQILAEVADKARPGMDGYATVLFSLLMEMSRAYQERRLHPQSSLRTRIADAIARTPAMFPPKAVVACQGVEGAYSQMACDKLFKHPSIMYFSSFEGVFKAVDEGLCTFGMLPIENSTAGTVNRVYDLMMEHEFHIVRTVRLKVDHCLLAKPGVRLEDIREIHSHEQAISQSASFLAGLPGVRVVPEANTAAAAQAVASSDRTDVAVLASGRCAELYDLAVLARSVQDVGNNYTRFACITKDLQIYPGADRASLMMVLPHRPGSLYKTLARFYAADVNLTKLESRPIPGRDFEFMFYFDLELPAVSPQFDELLGELEEFSEEFKYLGSYSELA